MRFRAWAVPARSVELPRAKPHAPAGEPSASWGPTPRAATAGPRELPRSRSAAVAPAAARSAGKVPPAAAPTRRPPGCAAATLARVGRTRSCAGPPLHALSPCLGDQRLYSLQLVRRNVVGPQQAEHQVRGRPIEDPVQEAAGAFVAAV